MSRSTARTGRCASTTRVSCSSGADATRSWTTRRGRRYELADEDRYLHGHDYYDHAGGDLWMAEETVRVLDEDREHECSGIEGTGGDGDDGRGVGVALQPVAGGLSVGAG